MRSKRTWINITVLAFLILVTTAWSAPAAWGATHTITKTAGKSISIPNYADGDTLAFVGSALEQEDWTALRELSETTFHLILSDATTAIPDYGLNYNFCLLSVAGKGIVDIGFSAFDYCTALRSAAFPAAVRIAHRAFYSCTELTKAIFPSVLEIGPLAFTVCTGLNEISFPVAISTGSHAFTMCTGLTEISFPAMTDIGNETFQGATSLTSISFPAAKNVGNSAFGNCSSLTGISLPAAENLGNGAFRDCTSLTSVSLPSAKKLEDYLFISCESLNLIELGNVPPQVGSEIFSPDLDDLLVLIPKGTSGSYSGWSIGADAQTAEETSSARGLLLLKPGDEILFSSTFAEISASGLQWQKMEADGLYYNVGSPGAGYRIDPVRTCDSGQYAMAFAFGGIAYRTAPVHLIVGSNPVLYPFGELQTVSVGYPANLAFEAEGEPAPKTAGSWLSATPAGTLWNANTLTLSGNPVETGLSGIWMYAENHYSLYSGKPASRIYSIDAVQRPVTGVSLNKRNTDLLLGGSEVLFATVMPENAANQDIVWSTDDPSVAIVYPGGRTTRRSSGGTVWGIGEGSATITATAADGGKFGSCIVNVSPLPVDIAGIYLNKTLLDLKEKESEQLIATILPSDATSQSIEWSSSNSAIAAVDADGFVHAISPGTAIIRVITADGKNTAECTVRVSSAYVPVRAVILNKNSTGLLVGNKETLYATVLPENATNKAVFWNSNSPSVAAILQGGRATRRSLGGMVAGVSPGIAVITVTTVDGNKTADCRVTVSPAPVPVTGIRLNKTSLDLEINGAERLYAMVLPSNATNHDVIWDSGNTAIASVEADGFVTGVAPGITYITATTADGGFSATCGTVVHSSSSSDLEIPELRLIPIRKGGTYSKGVFTIRMQVTAKNGSAKPPLNRVTSILTSFSPKNGARQLSWRFTGASVSDDILAVTGELLTGKLTTTAVESVLFIFDDGTRRIAELTPAPPLSELTMREDRGSGGCSVSGIIFPIPLLSLIVYGIGKRLKRGV